MLNESPSWQWVPRDGDLTSQKGFFTLSLTSGEENAFPLVLTEGFQDRTCPKSQDPSVSSEDFFGMGTCPNTVLSLQRNQLPPANSFSFFLLVFFLPLRGSTYDVSVFNGHSKCSFIGNKIANLQQSLAPGSFPSKVD